MGNLHVVLVSSQPLLILDVAHLPKKLAVSRNQDRIFLHQPPSPRWPLTTVAMTASPLPSTIPPPSSTVAPLPPPQTNYLLWALYHSQPSPLVARVRVLRLG